MVDIHSHILPNVDDGSRSMEMSKAMLSAYVGQGVGKVICTPHQNRDCANTDNIKRAYSMLKNEAKDYPVELYLGAEIYYYPKMIEDLSSGKLLTINGSKYVLVEFSTREATDIAEAVYEIVLAGYIPIVAHIERYPYLSRDDYFAIKNNGGFIQINAGAVLYRDTLKRVKFLLKNDLVDAVGSDCHDDKNRRVDFAPIKKFVQKKYSKLYFKLFEENL